MVSRLEDCSNCGEPMWIEEAAPAHGRIKNNLYDVAWVTTVFVVVSVVFKYLGFFKWLMS